MREIAYPIYRNSSTQWIGEIPTHWRIEKAAWHFGAEKGRDAQGLTKEYCGNHEGAYPVYSGQTENEGVMGRINTFEFDVGDEGVLFSTTVGAKAMHVSHLFGKFSLSQNCLIVRPRSAVFFLRYAYFTFQVLFRFERLLIPDHMQASFRMEDFYQYRVVLPPIEEQTQIAKFLDYETSRIDALIEKQRQLIELLKEKRQAVISHAVTKGLNPDAPMRDSGVEWLGEVPAHWQVLPTKRLFSLECHPAPKNNDMELLSVYTHIGVRPRKELEQKGNKASTTDGYWIVKKGDLVVNKLLAWMGAVGYSDYDGVTSPAYDILRKTRPLNPKFYHYLFRLENTAYEFKRWSRGIMEMRLRLYFEELGKIQVPLPSEREQNEVVAYIEGVEATFDRLAHKTEEQIVLLQERRTALISAAVTGKIDVRNWKAPDSETEVA